MIDIHMHIIPSVDDGAVDLQMAEAMLYMAMEQGVTDIIATSHSDAFLWNADKVKKNYEKLKELVWSKQLPVNLYLGCEVYCDTYLMEKVLKGLADGTVPSMNGTKYVLTEFYHINKKEALYCLNELLANNWIPIIAHAERYEALDMNFYENIKALGCLIQMNAFSIEEETKDAIRNKARALVEKGLVDFIGSDAHRSYHRPPAMCRGIDYLNRYYDKEYVERITWKNAQDLLIGTEEG